jgi:hypothetical protein
MRMDETRDPGSQLCPRSPTVVRRPLRRPHFVPSQSAEETELDR